MYILLSKVFSLVVSQLVFIRPSGVEGQLLLSPFCSEETELCQATSLRSLGSFGGCVRDDLGPELSYCRTKS